MLITFLHKINKEFAVGRFCGKYIIYERSTKFIKIEDNNFNLNDFVEFLIHSQVFTYDEYDYKASNIKVIRNKEPSYVNGTYLRKDLFEEYMRWTDTYFNKEEFISDGEEYLIRLNQMQ